MKCPLLLVGIIANSETDVYFEDDAGDCLEKNCAWWDESLGPANSACCVRSIQSTLVRIYTVNLYLANERIEKGGE